MRLFVAALCTACLPCAAQAQVTQPMPPSEPRLPGFVEVRTVETDPVVERDLRETRRTIDRRRDKGELSKREARRLRREVGWVNAIALRSGEDGLSEVERRSLEISSSELRARSALPAPARP